MWHTSASASGPGERGTHAFLHCELAHVNATVVIESQYAVSVDNVQPPPLVQRPAALAVYLWHALPTQPDVKPEHEIDTPLQTVAGTDAQPAADAHVGWHEPDVHEKQPLLHAVGQQALCGFMAPPQNCETQSASSVP